MLDESGAPMPAGRYFDASVVGLAGGQALRLTVLPEPATLSLLCGTAGLVLLKRRRS